MTKDVNVADQEALIDFARGVQAFTDNFVEGLRIVENAVDEDRARARRALSACEAKVEQCRRAVSAAKARYDAYMRECDDEDSGTTYDSAVADSLKQAIQQAEDELQRAKENLDRAKELYRDVKGHLETISEQAMRYITAISELGESADNVIRHKAAIIDKYRI